MKILILLKEKLFIEKEHEQSYLGLGMVLEGKDKCDEAVNSYKMVVKLNLFNEVAYNNIGSCYIKMRKYEEAIEQLQFALFIDPSYELPYFNLKSAYRALGNMKKVKEFAEKEKALIKPDQTKYKDMYRIKIE